MAPPMLLPYRPMLGIRATHLTSIFLWLTWYLHNAVGFCRKKSVLDPSLVHVYVHKDYPLQLACRNA